MNCLACENTISSEELFRYSNTKFPETPILNDLKIVSCNKCHFSFVDNPPRPEKLNEFYNEEYRSSTSPYHIDFLRETPIQFDARSLSQLSLATKLTDFKKGDFFLDLGPGKGYSFRSAQLLLPSPNLVSIEYSQEAIKYYEQYFEVENYKDLNEFQESGKLAKILLMSHSLEHFSYLEVPELLERIKSSLAIGGIAVVEVPHANLQLDREHLENDSPHLLFFSKAALSLLFENFGFEILAEGMVGSPVRKLPSGQAVEPGALDKLRTFLWRVFRKLARFANPNLNTLEIIDQRDFLLNFGDSPEGSCIRVVVKSKYQAKSL